MQHGRDFFQLQESVQAEGAIFETEAYRERFVEPFIQYNSQLGDEPTCIIKNQSYLKIRNPYAEKNNKQQ